MSGYEQKDGQGSMFRNDKKTTDKHPDFKGSVTIDGRQYWLSGWIRNSERAGEWISVSAQPKDANPAQGNSYAKKSVPQAKPAEDSLEDIPF